VHPLWLLHLSELCCLNTGIFAKLTKLHLSQSTGSPEGDLLVTVEDNAVAWVFEDYFGHIRLFSFGASISGINADITEERLSFGPSAEAFLGLVGYDGVDVLSGEFEWVAVHKLVKGVTHRSYPLA